MKLCHIHLDVQKNNIISTIDQLGNKRFDEKCFAQHFPVKILIKLITKQLMEFTNDLVLISWHKC